MKYLAFAPLIIQLIGLLWVIWLFWKMHKDMKYINKTAKENTQTMREIFAPRQPR